MSCNYYYCVDAYNFSLVSLVAKENVGLVIVRVSHSAESCPVEKPPYVLCENLQRHYVNCRYPHYKVIGDSLFTFAKIEPC